MIFNEELRKSFGVIEKEWHCIVTALFALKEDVALDIIRTLPDEHEKRERLYGLTQAISSLEGKLQGCLNEIKESQETE